MRIVTVKRIAQIVPLSLLAGAAVLLSGNAKGYPRLETVLVGSSQFISDSPAAIRVVCRDHIAGKGAAGAVVALALEDGKGASIPIYRGRTDSDGVVDANFSMPTLKAGPYTLVVNTAGLGEKDRIKSSIVIQRPVGILVTTDKPLYQPGQMVHIRALALWTGTKRPAATQSATIEVEDAKGNKVFKKIAKTSEYGILSADFQIASEVNTGQYKVRTVVGDVTEEKTITVDRYVLPKFKIALTTDREYYNPGGTLKGDLRVDYMFGKPVANSSVEATFLTYDVTYAEFAKVNGKTDAEGRFHFEQQLPDHFVGQPLEQGSALVRVDLKITDTADHEQTMTRQLPVASSGLILSAIPESATPISGLDMGIFVVATTPDGRPAANVRLSTDGSRNQWLTDASGLAEIRMPKTVFRTAGTNGYSITISGKDAMGNEAKTPLAFNQAAKEGILLRPFQSLVRAGSPLYCEAYLAGPAPTNTIYFDIVKDGRTVLTKTVGAVKGVARLAFHPTDDLAGTLRVSSYYISGSGQIIRDTRVVFVSPSTDLSVKLTLDRETYRPGENARLILQVGRRGASAVGLSIVDESVFALQEMQPGMERVYFLLEQELLHPRYEIHSITPGKLFQPGTYDESTQLAARALFAQAKPITQGVIYENSYLAKLEPYWADWKKDAERAATDVKAAAVAWQKTKDKVDTTTCPSDADWKTIIARGLISERALRDPWGRQYRIAAVPHWEWQVDKQVQKGFEAATVQSAGVDGRFDTNDDFGAVCWFNGGPVYAFEKQDGNAQWRDRMVLRAGGFGGGTGRGGFAEGDAFLGMKVANAAAPAAMREIAMDMSGAVSEAKSKSEDDAPRMRQYFPETLYWNPAIITDDTGKAEIEIPLADSITTWRLSASAVNSSGQMGSATTGLRVFQDFFVDIDLPVTLTQNDEVDVPVAVYNYLPGKQTIAVAMEPSDGMEMLSDRTQSVTMGANEVRAVYFRFRVTGLGMQKLTVNARGDKLSDAIRREIEVLPDGRREQASISDRLNGNTERSIVIPEASIDGASTLLVKVYPGVMSTLVEGLDKVLQMPGGCFEQTSSSTYPNVMILDYMKNSKQITPEIQMRAEQYINLGYQRLLSFEVPGGGFEWFGNAPANKVLTAYGLLEFADMAKVYNVDPAVFARTQAWLQGKQNADGSWTPDQGGIAEGAINRQSDVYKTTAYIAWAMAESNAQGVHLNKALAWLAKNMGAVNDPYALALTANAFLTAGDKGNGQAVVQKLLSKAKLEGDKLSFEVEGQTAVYGRGKSGDVETTALVTLALLKAGGHVESVNKAIGYIISAKDANGTWYSTQATVFALKALIKAAGSAGAGMNGEGRVFVNGQMIGTFVVTPDDYEVVRQFDAKAVVREGSNEVRIEWSGKQGPMFQISALYYVPWNRKPTDEAPEMDIQVGYDKTELAANDTVTSNVRVVYNGKGAAANMVIVDLGIPPGFDVMAGDLSELVGSKVIQKFSLTGRQAILYFDKLEKGKPVQFRYRMKAKYPLRARTPASRMYEYYEPERVSYSPPQLLEVRGR